MPKHKCGKSGKNKVEKMNDYESAIGDLVVKFSEDGSRADKSSTKKTIVKNKVHEDKYQSKKAKAGKPKNTRNEVGKVSFNKPPAGMETIAKDKKKEHVSRPVAKA